MTSRSVPEQRPVSLIPAGPDTLRAPREIFEELATARPARRADIVLQLIGEHPQGTVVLPAHDGLHAVLDNIDLSAQALSSRPMQVESLPWWGPVARCMNLKGADLKGASLRNADLRQAGLTASEFQGDKTIFSLTRPICTGVESLDPNPAGAHLGC
jgi:Pentapeptide repeats (8 copies)